MGNTSSMTIPPHGKVNNEFEFAFSITTFIVNTEIIYNNPEP